MSEPARLSARPNRRIMMRMGARSWLFASLAVVIALLGAGCTQGGDESSPASPGDSSRTSDEPEEIARSSEQIDIGGRSLHMQCWGEPATGEPTVLLITGHGPRRRPGSS